MVKVRDDAIPPPATAPSFQLQAAGVVLVVLSTIAIAIVPSLAKLAYDGGSNTLSVITGRSIFSVLITLLLVVALRQPLVIAKRPLFIGLAMGVGYAVILYGYLGAVNYLPVSLVILIYFIHPLLVGFIVTCLGQERLTLVSVGALAAALVGLGLAIGFPFDNTNLTGIGLATLAMIVTAIVIVGNARAMREAPALSIGL
jgi:drug/metabolite transporter (DMT)-like permease